MTRCPWKEAHQPWPSVPGITAADFIPLCIHVLASVRSTEHSSKRVSACRNNPSAVLEGTRKRVVSLTTLVWRMLLVYERKHQRDANSNPSIPESACFKSMHPAVSLEYSLLGSV